MKINILVVMVVPPAMTLCPDREEGSLQPAAPPPKKSAQVGHTLSVHCVEKMAIIVLTVPSKNRISVYDH
jgi:hypothetical protein